MRHTPAILALAAACLPAVAQPLDKNAKVHEIYRDYCAACHGTKFEGGLGGSLVDGAWNHGAGDEEIYRSIAKGNEALGMQPWEGVLSEQQIRAMVIFLREKEKEERYRKTEFPQPATGRVTATKLHKYRLEEVAKGLDIPWAIAFLPDGRRLVTERPGPLRILSQDGELSDPVAGTPKVAHHGQGGMMDVAVHPDYARNGWIYLAYADGERQQTLTAIVRGRIKGNRWTDEETIWRGDRKFYGGAGVHFGSRIVFDRGFVFFVIGERGGWHEAQDVKRPNGKIFRLHDDGRVPADNPFVNVEGAEPGIWSYGHRNPQGLAFHPETGDLFSTEHGPRGGDEFNLVLKGRNYGWPVITYGMHYDGRPITSETARAGMEQPVLHWTPSIAACGLACLDGSKFPRWQHDFFAGGLASQEVRRLRLGGGKVIEDEVVVKGIGRVRDVKASPAGLLYLVLNDPHRIVRLVPAD
jgi:aldose sugar dehydrogenase